MPHQIVALLPQRDTKIILECNGEEWQVVWKIRGDNNGGLSGGWRGFAVDQRIAVHDTVVFRKLPGLRLGVTVFRHWDIDGGKDAAFEQGCSYADTTTEWPLPVGPGIRYTMPQDHVYSQKAAGATVQAQLDALLLPCMDV